MLSAKLLLPLCVVGLLLQARAGFAQSNKDQPVTTVPLTDRERMLLDRIDKLEQRVESLEAKAGGSSGTSVASNAAPGASALQPASVPAGVPQQTSSSEPAVPLPALSFLDGTTLNVAVDGYYGYNFNDPIGRVNLLRAYDVSSNAFSLNQADFMIENAPDPDHGKRFGLRLDFQYGQATETLQGNPANEPRPDIYRNIFQAYGTYVVPVGHGLTIDVGKFASSLGIEGNYTKDQMNYSRSYWFNFLPFYHEGLRASYKFNDKLTANYWVVNGTQQTEPFNGYKDEFFGLTLNPVKSLTWNVNYYVGQEHPDVTYYPNGGAPAGAPTLQGAPFEPISNPPGGKLHIFDTYFNWKANGKWQFAGELDDQVERLYENSRPAHTAGGSGYAQYQILPKVALAGRFEYLTDRGGLFSGTTQALKEGTFTAKYQLANGFDMFGEWRQDFSNQPYFYTSTLGVLRRRQNTATLGLVWWLGGKQGAW